MSEEEKFNAAVNIIRNLPKNGPFQPSNGIMLKFYAYYKQAKEGPNVSTKPPFWDVIKKAKWESWKRLGDMPRETAMIKYVDEFKKIVDTLSHTHNVDNMSEKDVNSLYLNLSVEDLELLMGPSVVEKVRSRPGSPFSTSPLTSREASPHRKDTVKVSSESTQCGTDRNPGEEYGINVDSVEKPVISQNKEDDEEESFLDTIENPSNSIRRVSPEEEATKLNSGLTLNESFDRKYPVIDDSQKNVSVNGEVSGYRDKNVICDGPNNIVLKTLLKLNQDIDKVFERLVRMEDRLSKISKEIRTVSAKCSNKHNGHSVMGYSPTILMFLLICWPVVTQLVQFWFLRRKFLKK